MLSNRIYDVLLETHSDGMAVETLNEITRRLILAISRSPADLEDVPVYNSVLQDWVAKIPLRAQGTLLTCVRGCDLTPKFPLDSPERQLVGMLRHSFMVPADPREVGVEPGAFFQRAEYHDIIGWTKKTKFSALGHYPQHWVSHVMHSAEVLGYCHPDDRIAGAWLAVYNKFCHNMHVPPETREQFFDRMTEDRIAKGTVVS